MDLALFDFDGTITTDDSLIGFIRFAVGNSKFMFGMILLSPMLITYKLKIISNSKAKQWMLSYFFKGMNKQQFQTLAKEYSLKHIDTILRPRAMKKIAWHKQQGHTVVIVSASIECWLRPWCHRNGLELIGTKLEMKNDTVTGKFLTKNCYAIEKVNRIKEAYNISDYHQTHGYGDSRGDKELLNFVDIKNYQIF